MPIVVLVLIAIQQVFAAKLSVQYGLKKYEVTYSDKLIHLSANMTEVSISKNGCNKKSFEKTLQEIKSMTAGSPLIVGSKPNQVNFSLNGTNYNTSPGSDRGKKLILIPDFFRLKKIQETLHCNGH